MHTPIIHVQNATKSFSALPVLKGLNISVPQRSVYAFLGNNGEGKSTTIRMLLGLLRADSGSIQVLGKDVAQLDKRQVGAIIDAPVLYAHLTAREYLSITRSIKNLSKSEIARVLELVSLTKAGNRKISTFSLGMKQRLALAQALMGDPKLLILDEPTNGLDPQGMQEIRELIKQLPEQSDTSVFVSSHLLDEVEKMASHVGILRGGKLVLESSLEHAYKQMTSTLKLDVCSSQKAAEVLKVAGYQTVQETPSSLNVLNPVFEQIPDVTACLIKKGVQLFQAVYHKPTLEQWFLSSNKQGA
ncbi:ATP-binding cassette domain-containing protein [Alteromonas sediminis]|uniref:ATP-binding cassette domain-containing protein n=1 Tax=Alteromonas sediminis TaxID=2259342 RepID=A0A3N5Z585_9ALTE|nr:ATP-binding cassette domain-containing protein [Alteromonas sediminis]RPJ65424.1 ATP-binding cassette domain-containing protein [Alteromonas sediminis]